MTLRNQRGICLCTKVVDYLDLLYLEPHGLTSFGLGCG
jgi:hypothetical protein